MKHFISFSILFALLGCDAPETKKIISTYENGQPEIVIYYPKGEDTLTYRKEVFYKTGKQDYIGNILENKKEGIWTWWYENGNKKDQSKYADGYYVDTVFHWYESGTIRQLEIVESRTVRTDGCCNCNGTVIRYYKNGNPMELFRNIDTIQEDTAKTWYKNGQLEWYAYFKNGEEEGLSETYYRNGQTMRSGKIKNGLLQGNVTRWDSLGNVISVMRYQKGNIIEQNATSLDSKNLQ